VPAFDLWAVLAAVAIDFYCGLHPPSSPTFPPTLSFFHLSLSLSTSPSTPTLAFTPSLPGFWTHSQLSSSSSRFSRIHLPVTATFNCLPSHSDVNQGIFVICNALILLSAVSSFSFPFNIPQLHFPPKPTPSCWKKNEFVPPFDVCLPCKFPKFL